MTLWRFAGVALPAGVDAELTVGIGQEAALPGRFAIPGLVDAHCHLSVAEDAQGPHLTDRESAERELRATAEAGVTSLRDTGGEATITLALAAGRQPGRPQVLASGRFLSPAGRYFPRMHVPVSAEELVGVVHDQVDAGAVWIKIIGDFPTVVGQQVVRDSAVEQTYDLATMEAAVTAAHDRGVRVAVHSTSPVVSQLVALGVDSVEHGSSLTDADLLALSRRGGAWTPTLSALLFKPPADADGRLRLGALRERLAALLAQAHALGVTILAGSDVVGSVAAEVALLVDHGMSVDAAMAAASTSAQAYLGVDTTTDLVTYERDPREDLSALHSPAAVVIGGQRVR